MKWTAEGRPCCQ